MQIEHGSRATTEAPQETHVSMGRRRVLSTMAGLLALGTLDVQAIQAYPQRPITLIVPFVPSGPVDIAGRTIGAALGASLGQSVVIVNKAGAGGGIGAAEISRSQPDGHQLLIALDSILTVNPTFYRDQGYAAQPLDPIGMVGELSSVLVVNAKSPIRSVSDFIDHARKTTMMSGSGGNGTAGHLYAEWLKRDFGLKLEHVPYKGLAPAVKDLLTGEIDCIVALIPGVLPHVQAGTLRALGLTSPRPQVLLPDVRPLSAQGLKGFEGASWLAVMAPLGIDSSILSRLGKALSNAVSAPETVKRLQAAGIDPFYRDARHVRERIATESKQWETLLAQIKDNENPPDQTAGKQTSQS